MLAQNINSHILNDIERSEEDELCLVILAHSFDMRFDRFYNMFPILQCKLSVNIEPFSQNDARTFAVPWAMNSRTARLPSFVCTISARTSWHLADSQSSYNGKSIDR